MLKRRDVLATGLAATLVSPLMGQQSLAQDGASEGNADAAGSAEKEQQAGPKPLATDMVRNFVGASHGNLKVVQGLVAKEPELVHAAWDWVAGDFETGLGAASHVGNRDIANFLLDKQARIDVFAMAMLGHKKLLESIFSVYPKTHAVPGPHGIPLLSHAVYGKEEADDVLEFLIESGADVNQASKGGQTSLMAAATLGRIEVLELLVKHGAVVDQQDAKGSTALDYAKSREQEKAMQYLKDRSS